MTSELFEKNLATLRLYDSALADYVKYLTPDRGDLSLERARNGQMVAKKRGFLLHSAYDPEKEAATWSSSVRSDNPRSICVLGCGLGYHLTALAKAGFRGSFIDPDPVLFRFAMEHHDFTSVLAHFQPLIGISLDRLRRSQRDLLAGEVLPHPASIRANDEYFSPLIDYARALGLVRQENLKILVVNPIYGGSLPAARHCATALRKLGHTVDVFTSEAFAAGLDLAGCFHEKTHQKSFTQRLADFIGVGVEWKAKEFAPDLVLALAQAPLHIPNLRRLAAQGIPTAFWFVEDYRVLPYWQDVAAEYGYFFGIQRGEFVGKLQRCGVTRYAYLPTAAAPDIHMPVTLHDNEIVEFGSPLSFVGAGYHNRQRFFRGLTDYTLKIWGSEWPMTQPLAPFIQRNASRIDTETCVKIFNASAINLNLHSSTYLEGIDPEGDFVNPRTFEIACCSAFQLVDRRHLMLELFSGDELETYGCMQELRDKIEHYLCNHEDRRSKAAKGRLRVLNEHTYEVRMEELLALMITAYPNIGARLEERRLCRQKIREEFKTLPGGERLLLHLPMEAEITLDAVWQAIDREQGTLSRAERIFLMLKNIQVAKGKNS